MHPEQFFALPQSPQLFKQLLMVAGFDRYYQIVKCFRDEDLRADRQPEFTQIDIETSFLDEDEIRAMMEEDGARGVQGGARMSSCRSRFRCMTLCRRDARYGSDKPDLRVSLKLTELTDVMRDVEFKVFAGGDRAEGWPGRRAARPGRRRDAALGDRRLYRVRQDLWRQGSRVHQGQSSRRRAATGCRARSSRTCPMPRWRRSSSAPGRKDGDLIFFGADRAKIVNDALGALRVEDRPQRVRPEHGLSKTAGSRCGWSTSRCSSGTRRTSAGSPRITRLPRPKDGHEDYLSRPIPAQALAKAYDMVLNGWEIGGGSVRIHREDVQSKVFRALKIGAEEAGAKFGFLLDALQYGAPPHGGIAFGLDRSSR